MPYYYLDATRGTGPQRNMYEDPRPDLYIREFPPQLEGKTWFWRRLGYSYSYCSDDSGVTQCDECGMAEGEGHIQDKHYHGGYSTEAEALAAARESAGYCPHGIADDGDGCLDCLEWQDCGSCGMTHPKGYWGDCRNDQYRR